jgi:hypothetical protein
MTEIERYIDSQIFRTIKITHLEARQRAIAAKLQELVSLRKLYDFKVCVEGNGSFICVYYQERKGFTIEYINDKYTIRQAKLKRILKIK